MKYYFALGNNFYLSLAEIFSVFQSKNWSFSIVSVQKDVAIFDLLANPEDVAPLINRMGGVIKIGVIYGQLTSLHSESLAPEIEKFILPHVDTSAKFNFGLSYYGSGRIDTKVIGMSVKKLLQSVIKSVRWVTSRDPRLSSVVIATNHLLDRGAEICVFKQDKGFLWGKTLSVQPFRDLSSRDYGRPSRDDLSGMLPPKLAQIMLNLAEIDNESIILDPFCGSGTVLMEAALMGCKNIIGSDISPKAIEDTRDNLIWLQKKFTVNHSAELTVLSAIELSKKHSNESVDRIVSEPYLGPQRGQIDVKKVVPELNDFYSRALVEFHKILKPDGRVVMVWPVFYQKYRLDPDVSQWEMIDALSPAEGYFGKKQADGRPTIIYGRPEQKVWREIVVLTKKKK